MTIKQFKQKNQKKQAQKKQTNREFGYFDYTFKKQTGGPGQYARVIGRLEPCGESFEFENGLKGGEIPKEFVPACEKGFRDAVASGYLAGYPIIGVKVVLEGGNYHPVDSTERAFREAARQGFYQGFAQADPVILEPIALAVVEAPNEYIGSIQGDLLSRRGILVETEMTPEGVTIRAEVPLSAMFGYVTALRSLSCGRGAFSMTFCGYRQVPSAVEQQLMRSF